MQVSQETQKTRNTQDTQDTQDTSIFNLEISEKFEKELVTFMLWLSDSDYKISKSKDSEELEWSIDLLGNFKEPGRNKLECYIKELMKEYFISYENEEINDIKSITKNFRENKSKIYKQVKSKKRQNSSSVKSESSFVPIKKENVKKNNKNVFGLDITTEMLVEVLGMPNYYKNSHIKYRWDIKCDKTEKSFVIYNWVNEDGTFHGFENTQWYIVDYEKSDTSYIEFMNFFKDKKNIANNVSLNVNEKLEDLNPNTYGNKEHKRQQKKSKKPEQEPEKEPEQEPEQEPEKEPEQEPEQEPEKEPEQEPEQESPKIQLKSKQEDDYANLEIDLDDIEFDDF
jgi:hypothetical protein